MHYAQNEKFFAKEVVYNGFFAYGIDYLRFAVCGL